VSRRRLVPLALLVAALLGVVAVAARGRPLGSGGSGGGPSSGFFDYVYTSVVIVVVLSAVAMTWLLVTNQPGLQRKTRGRRHPLVTFLFVVAWGLIMWGLSSNTFQRRLHAVMDRLHIGQKLSQKGASTNGRRAPPRTGQRGAKLRWDEVAIALAVLGALGVVALGARRRRPSSRWQIVSQAAVSAALDESLDDLRSEPDLRKAIIAAYARMERALAAGGMPRRPAEAPLEYVERALAELETSAGAIRRLTDLFEWARFSQHEPEPSMRDEAIDALVAVRDELRAPVEEPVAA
jgi:Domain of unknown function (DUF4129)